jgi:hypothetical protein
VYQYRDKVGIITAVDGLGTSLLRIKIDFDDVETEWLDYGPFDRVDNAYRRLFNLAVVMTPLRRSTVLAALSLMG